MRLFCFRIGYSGDTRSVTWAAYMSRLSDFSRLLVRCLHEPGGPLGVSAEGDPFADHVG